MKIHVLKTLGFRIGFTLNVSGRRLIIQVGVRTIVVSK